MVKMEDCLDRANQLRQEGKWDEAIAVYYRALKLDPNAYQSYHFIGETLAQKGELEAAAKFYNLARETNPNLGWAYHCLSWSYHCLGTALFGQGKLDEAIAASIQAIELKPNQAIFHYQLGLYLERKLDLDSASEAYLRALILEPKFTQASCRLELVWTQQEQEQAQLTKDDPPSDLTAQKAQNTIDLKTMLSQGRIGWLTT